MTIVRYQPYELVQRVQREFGQLFGNGFDADQKAGWTPAVDVREDAERFVVTADLPGVAAADISVTAEDGVLSVKGERRLERQESKDGYTRFERAEGRFERRFTLPDNVNAEQISARHANGVLEISLPKQAVSQPRKIDIAVN